MKPIKEIRTDYVSDQNLQHVDVWHTADDAEQGVTAAVFCLDTGKEIYFRNEYRAYEEVETALGEIKAEWKEPQAEKMLVVSTSHLPQAAYEALSKRANMSREEGDLFYVGDPNTYAEHLEIELIHDNVSQLVYYARKAGCCWLLFDRDADPIKGVTTFDW